MYSGILTSIENMEGALQNLMGEGGGLIHYMGGGWGGLKTVLKNTCERVHLLVKLPASLQIY